MVMDTKNRFSPQMIADESVFAVAEEPVRNALGAGDIAARGGLDLLQEIEHEMRAAAMSECNRAAQTSQRYLVLLMVAGSRALHQQRHTGR